MAQAPTVDGADRPRERRSPQMALRVRQTLYTLVALAAFLLALGAPQRWFN